MSGRGQMFFPPESMLYAFSLSPISSGSAPLSPERLLHRVRVFADLIEWIVLTDEIGIEQEWQRHLDPWLSEYDLVRWVRPLPDIHLPLVEHAPSSMAGLLNSWGALADRLRELSRLDGDELAPFADADTVRKLQELARAAELADVLGPLFAPDQLGVMARHTISEAVDFLGVVYSRMKEIDGPDDGPNADLVTRGLQEWRRYVEQGETEVPALVVASLGPMMMGYVESGLRYSARAKLAFYPSVVERHFLNQMPMFAPSSQVLLRNVERVKYEAAAKLNDYFYDRYSDFIRLPLLFNVVAQRAATVRELFEIALDLRDRKDVRRFRQWCGELDAALQEGKEAIALKMIAQAERFIQFELKSEERHAGDVSVQLSFPPAVSFGVPDSLFAGRRNHLVFLRKLSEQVLGPLPMLQKTAKLFGYPLTMFPTRTS